MIVLIDATNISQDVLIRLVQTKDGRYFIERWINREWAKSSFFPILEETAKELMNLSVEDAWHHMEMYVMQRNP